MTTTIISSTSRQELSVPVYEGPLMRFQDGTQSRYHVRARQTFRPTDEVRLAEANRPFGELSNSSTAVQEALQTNPIAVQNAIAEQAAEFLRNMWPMFEEDQLGFPVSFSVNEADDPTEQENFARLIERNVELGLTQQASGELPPLFDNFVETRRVLRSLRQQNLLLPHTIMADKHLPWFTVTAPVWFVRSRESINFQTKEPDPKPDTFVKYMAKRLGTQRLADWYQLWNRRSRPFADYQGDVIPTYLLDAITMATEVFDYVAIATPYHGVASTEWADPNWQRLIDPYLLGFSKRLPSLFFFIGRWSNTGLFPLAAEMTAHTMAYLRQHIHVIPRAFNQPYWEILGEKNNAYTKGELIHSVAQGALQAFEEHKLFDWLSEGRPEPKLILE